MPDDTLRILVTFALEPDLVEQITAVDPRIRVDVLGRDQRQLLRGFRYPSERERAAVAEGLQGAFAEAGVVFGFWGAELHNAIKLEGAIREVAPRLKWIQLTSAGADRLLNSGFIEEGIAVTTVSGLHATPIGEYVLCTMLMFAKGMPRTMRAQVRGEWSRFAPTELRGKTVGIVGMGHIGEEVARLSKAFGCRVIATRRSVTG
ncbi:MAG TPA: NAD(P)-dependent oxidoreductase, partial [Dehalococcoidia bacterium]|nr:NAD(P)-dependent oxidoreductase [Dehalococcoidia bacterium]